MWCQLCDRFAGFLPVLQYRAVLEFLNYKEYIRPPEKAESRQTAEKARL